MVGFIQKDSAKNNVVESFCIYRLWTQANK
jgi:hypothetical protein